MDGVSWAIASGMLHYPRPCANPSYLPCHKIRAVVAVRATLGEMLARILGQGAAELFAPGPVGSIVTLTAPNGAGPKAGNDSFRDIADGRDERVSTTDWGTLLGPARGLAAEPSWWLSKHGSAANDGFRPPSSPGGTGGRTPNLGAADARRVFDGDPAGRLYKTPGEDGPARPVPVPRSRQTCPAPRCQSHPGGRPDTCSNSCDQPYCGV